MTRHCQNLISCLLLAAGLLAAGLPAAADPAPPWAVPGAPFRLRLEKAEDAPWPAPAAVASFTTGPVDPARCRVTMTTAGGRIVPSSVLWARTGEPLTLLFETGGEASACYAYVEEGPPAAPSDWKPRAGVILETRMPEPAGFPKAFDSSAGFETAWQSATGTWGRGVRGRIFEGVHPFGPPENFLARFEAWFTVDARGEYGFATLSDDASFLSVDGRPVAAWPGIHSTDEGRMGDKKGFVTLEPGPHRLQYDAAQSQSLFAAVAAWKRPDMRYFDAMPPQAFIPLTRYTARLAETPEGDPPHAWFTWQIARSVRMDELLLSLVSVRAPVPEGASCRWDFGRGFTNASAAAETVFIGPGPRKIRLEVSLPGGSRVAAEQTLLIQPLWSQLEDCPDASLFPIREALLAADPAAFRLDELESAALFARRVGDPVWMDRLGDECLRRKGFSPGFRPTLHALGQNARLSLFRKYAGAEALFTLALALTNAPDGVWGETRLRLDRAENRLNGLGSAEGAQADLEALPDAAYDAPGLRRKRLLAADVALARGRREEARLLAASEPPVETGTAGAIHRQARLMTAADYLRRKEWHAAAEKTLAVLHDFPLERFNGETVLRLMEAEAGRGETLCALRRGERLLQLDLLDDTRANLLLALSRLYAAAGQPEAAGRSRQLLKRDFPYSEAAARAGAN